MSQLASRILAISHTEVGLGGAPHLSIERIHCKSVFSSVSVNLRFIQLVNDHCLIPFNHLCKVLKGMSYNRAAFCIEEI